MEAGWYDDPTGRFEQRYHDGARWTEHVASQGQQVVDPAGAPAAHDGAPAPAASAAATQEGLGSGRTTPHDGPRPAKRLLVLAIGGAVVVGFAFVGYLVLGGGDSDVVLGGGDSDGTASFVVPAPDRVIETVPGLEVGRPSLLAENQRTIAICDVVDAGPYRSVAGMSVEREFSDVNAPDDGMYVGGQYLSMTSEEMEDVVAEIRGLAPGIECRTSTGNTQTVRVSSTDDGAFGIAGLPSNAVVWHTETEGRPGTRQGGEGTYVLLPGEDEAVYLWAQGGRGQQGSQDVARQLVDLARQ